MTRERGWYPDPDYPWCERYWNGRVWGGRRRARRAAVGNSSAGSVSGAIPAGWVCAVVLPPVGFVIGVVLLTKGLWEHGVGMMVTAFLVVLLVVPLV